MLFCNPFFNVTEEPLCVREYLVGFTLAGNMRVHVVNDIALSSAGFHVISKIVDCFSEDQTNAFKCNAMVPCLRSDAIPRTSNRHVGRLQNRIVGCCKPAVG